MGDLEDSCSRASEYPCNLLYSELPPLMLDGFRQELHRQAARLFCQEDKASVDFLEISISNDGMLVQILL